MQETHLSESEHKKLTNTQLTQIYSASYNSKKRGVAILINKNITVINQSTICDPEGRYVIVNITFNNKILTIANIYGPNTDDPQFFHNFFSSIANVPQSAIIIGGDFNTVIDPTQDKYIITL